MSNFLDANFEPNDSGSSTTRSHSEHKSSLCKFAGLFNTFFPIRCSTKLVPILVTTAILVCLENSFWNQATDSDFVDSFKKSFTLYVESGIRKTTEAAIDVLRNEQGGHPVTVEFEAKLHKIIMDHRLCKLDSFYSHSTFLTFFFVLNPAHPEDQDAA